MWHDQSEEIIVHEFIICQTIWDDPSGQVQIAHLTANTIWKRLALQLMVERISDAVTMSDIPFVCFNLQSISAHSTQNTGWENFQQNCHVILFILRQSWEFVFMSVCLCDYHSELVMNLCSWVTSRLLLAFSAAFRNFCPSPLECTGEKHSPENYMKSTFFLVQMSPANDYQFDHLFWKM